MTRRERILVQEATRLLSEAGMTQWGYKYKKKKKKRDDGADGPYCAIGYRQEYQA